MHLALVAMDNETYGSSGRTSTIPTKQTSSRFPGDILKEFQLTVTLLQLAVYCVTSYVQAMY